MMTAAQVAERIVREDVAPMAAAGWAKGAARDVGGRTDVLFDLASVTKPMTAVAVAWAHIDPTRPLGAWVPEARGTASETVSLELLLSHRAGLDAHRTLYAPLLRGEAVDETAALREAADARRSDARGDPPPQGFPPLYSDLGYVLAGVALARAVGARDAGEAIERIVLEPLGLAGCAGTIRDLAGRGVGGPFAPTETVAWRGGQVVGAVHDENAWALTGLGGSGHAGIFGTVDAVLTFGLAALEGIRSGELEWLVRERVGPGPRRAGGTLRAGFDGKSPEGSSAGSRMGPRTVGHLGFTGTSLWIDPDAGVVVSLLTNRVCPSREHVAIRTARPWVHDALFQAAVGSSR